MVGLELQEQRAQLGDPALGLGHQVEDLARRAGSADLVVVVVGGVARRLLELRELRLAVEPMAAASFGGAVLQAAELGVGFAGALLRGDGAPSAPRPADRVPPSAQSLSSFFWWPKWPTMALTSRAMRGDELGVRHELGREPVQPVAGVDVLVELDDGGIERRRGQLDLVVALVVDRAAQALLRAFERLLGSASWARSAC